MAEMYPHAIIVVPTAELAHQCHGVIDHLVTGTPLTVGVASESRAVLKPSARVGGRDEAELLMEDEANEERGSADAKARRKKEKKDRKKAKRARAPPFPSKGTFPSILVTTPGTHTH